MLTTEMIMLMTLSHCVVVNQFTIACELDMINAISAAHIAFIMSSSTSAWLLSPLKCSSTSFPGSFPFPGKDPGNEVECSPQKQNS